MIKVKHMFKGFAEVGPNYIVFLCAPAFTLKSMKSLDIQRKQDQTQHLQSAPETKSNIYGLSMIYDYLLRKNQWRNFKMHRPS